MPVRVQAATYGARMLVKNITDLEAVAYPEFFLGGGSTNSVEDRENGDLGAAAP
jgi:hypothetical protein